MENRNHGYSFNVIIDKNDSTFELRRLSIYIRKYGIVMVIVDNHNKIMKILLTFIVLFFSSSAFSETYYCVEKDAIGFDGKTYKNTNFNLIKFIAEIDFNRLLFEAADILLDTKLNAHNCYNNWKDSSMQCINGEGTSFSINKKSKLRCLKWPVMFMIKIMKMICLYLTVNVLNINLTVP